MISKRFRGIISVIAICALFALVSFMITNQGQLMNTSGNTLRFILDAGHGNPDGGTVSTDGTKESDLNLAITSKISKALSQKNISNLMTRTSEESIYTEGKTIHEKKVSDVRNRIDIAAQTPDVPLVSIHMNSYPDPSVYGIQVFYGNGDLAKKMATDLQSAINTNLQPNHPKVAKQVSKNVYLFSHINNPVILIECGFLTNKEELSKLMSEEYQIQLAEVIAQVLSAHS